MLSLPLAVNVCVEKEQRAQLALQKRVRAPGLIAGRATGGQCVCRERAARAAGSWLQKRVSSGGIRRVTAATRSSLRAAVASTNGQLKHWLCIPPAAVRVCMSDAATGQHLQRVHVSQLLLTPGVSAIALQHLPTCRQMRRRRRGSGLQTCGRAWQPLAWALRMPATAGRGPAAATAGMAAATAGARCVVPVS